MKLEQTTWEEILSNKKTPDIKPKYFAHLKKYKSEFRPTNYAIAFSEETLKAFEEKGYYELTEKMFSPLRLNLPIFYYTHEKELAKKALERLAEIYGYSKFSSSINTKTFFTP